MQIRAPPSSFTMLSALLFCSIAASAPVQETSLAMYSGQPQPERWVLYDLERPFGAFDNGNDSATDLAVEKRRQISVCERTLAAVASCFVIEQGIERIGGYIGNVISDLSNRRDCGTFSGSIAGVSFKYQANGKNCDTTAEQKTIQGAIMHHLETIDNGELCHMECLDLTHGGTWDGFLLLGPASSFDATQYCGPQLSRDQFSQCSSGGKEDAS